MKPQLYHITKKDLKDEKKISKGPNTGKPFWQAGLNIDGAWYNGTCWTVEDKDRFEAMDINKQQMLVLYEEPKKEGDGVWNKWRFPKDTELLGARMDQAATVIKEMDEKIKGIAADFKKHKEDIEAINEQAEQLQRRMQGIENKLTKSE